MRISLSVHRGFVALFSVAIVCGASTAGAADLSAGEKQHFDLAKKYQAQFEANLKLASETAGPGDAQPPASKAKLAMARLQSARQSAANVAARLEKLPADNDDVRALQAEYDKTMKAVTALDDRLTGKNAPPPAAPADAPSDQPAAPTSTPAPPAKEAKLGYKAEEAFRIATANVAVVAACADHLEKNVAEVTAAKDKSTVPLATLKDAIARIREARTKTENARVQFEQLPAEHSLVKAAADELKAAVARVDAAEKVIEPVYKQTMEQADSKNYPDLDADKARLRELTKMLAVGNLQSEFAAAAELIKQLPAMKEEGTRLGAKYKLLLSHGGDKDLENDVKRLAFAIERFEEAVAKEKETLPTQIDGYITTAAKLGEEGVRDKKPLYFKGGVAGNLGFAEERLILYSAIDPAGAKATAEKLAKTRETLKAQERSLSGDIIASNDLPPDQYAGPDKADLVRRATEALKKQRPKAEVLAVRIPSEKWARETKWRNQNNEWYRIDHSKLQAQVIVKRDDQIAEVHPINLWTDHMKENAITAVPLYDEKEELQPGSLLLISKVK